MNTSVYLMTHVYPDGSEFHPSDQISVSADIWESFHVGWESERPLFFRIGSAICRMRPDTEVPYDTCRIPDWLWLQLGTPGPDDWISVAPETIPDAKRLVLRAFTERSLTDMEDPVTTLTLALSGADGPGWSCLNRGAELPLACGNFSIVDILDEEERSVEAACILNVDLELDIVPAADARPATPIPAPTEPLGVPATPLIPSPSPSPSPYRNGFVPFSGVGRRLCD